MNPTKTSIKKNRLIKGENLYFRNAEVKDAEFIFNLRRDEKKSRYISKTDNDLNKQISWLQEYAQDESQAYFIILDKNLNPIGTVRLYDQQQNSFCWGSWILKEDTHISSSIESVLITYEYALMLGFKNAHFDVRIQNKSVWRFHERFGAQKIKETELDYFYTISHKEIEKSLKKYREFLPNGIILI